MSTLSPHAHDPDVSDRKVCEAVAPIRRVLAIKELTDYDLGTLFRSYWGDWQLGLSLDEQGKVLRQLFAGSK